MTQAEAWNLPAARKRILALLDKADQEATALPDDHSGNGVPVAMAVMFLLEQAVERKLYGTVEVTIKGSMVLSPKLTNQTHRLTDLYESYIR